MLSYKILDLYKHVNQWTCNTLQIVEDVDTCFGEVNIKIGDREIMAYYIIEKGNYLNISMNILNTLFDKCFVRELTITIDRNNVKSLKDISFITELFIQPLWNVYTNDFDFSSSIFEYFSNDCYLSVNDCIKVPINFYDSSMLLQKINSNLIYFDYFFVNVLSISSDKVSDNHLYFFDHTSSKMIFKSNDVIHKRVFDIDFNFKDYNDSLDNFLEVVVPVIRTNECVSLLTMVGHPLIHVYGPSRSGKGTLIYHTACILGHRYINIRASDLTGQTSSAIEKKLDNIISVSKGGNFVSIHFEDFDSLFLNSSEIVDGKYDQRTIRSFTKMLDSLSKLTSKEIVLFLSTVSTDLPTEVDRFVLIRYDAEPTSDVDRRSIVRQYLTEDHDAIDDLVKLSVRTPRIELISAMRALSSTTVGTGKEVVDKFKSIAVSGRDKDSAAIDSVCWRDIGGLGEIIKEVLATIKLILSEHKPVVGYSVRKSGILLYGDPGTGKTLLAKAVASECNLNFISVKGPELLNMYVGQTEENVRSLFSRVKRMVPCLLFCDELDSIVPRRGFSGDSGGVMDRVVSQFALELDSINNEENMRIVVMGATNRPDLIDPALLRNGRFDNLFHVVGGLDKSDQLEILRSQTYKLTLDGDVDLEEIVEHQFPSGVMTGARIYGVVSSAIVNAIRRTVTMIEGGIVDEDCDLTVCREDFVDALREVTK